MAAWRKTDDVSCGFSFCLLVALVIGLGGCRRPIEDGIDFVEVAPSQAIAVTSFAELKFTDENGDQTLLTDLVSGDYLVVIITRGFDNAICLYCSSQTSKWARRHDELEKYNATLAVVFPTIDRGDDIKLPMLRDKILHGDVPNDSIPYPILLDLDLQSVDQLGLRAALAKPATYIINSQGNVLYGYVGQSIADRPSVDAVLTQLSQIRSDGR